MTILEAHPNAFQLLCFVMKYTSHTLHYWLVNFEDRVHRMLTILLCHLLITWLLLTMKYGFVPFVIKLFICILWYIYVYR